MTDFIPPWERYKEVTKLVRQGDIGAALNRQELEWLDNDLKSWVATASKPDFDGPVVRFLDGVAGTTPDESSVEARIYQRWSAYPQIGAMLFATGIPREAIIGKIKTLMQEPEE
ncbi:MAG: hypothetical protein WAV41_04040 [Microgenomates group bacterium]